MFLTAGMFTCAVIAVLIVSPLAIAMPNDTLNQAAALKAERERRIAPLRAAGVNIDSADELIRVLDKGQVPVQIAAAYLLKEKKVKSAVPQLEKLAKDPSTTTLLRLNVCDALSELAPVSSNWKDPCKRLLREAYDSATRIRAAGVLAKSGDTSGWNLIREGLRSSQPGDVEEASAVAPLFNGLPSETDGTKINVMSICAEAFGGADVNSQGWLLGIAWKVAKPEDAQLLSSMLSGAKSQYLKDYVRTLIRQKTGK